MMLLWLMTLVLVASIDAETSVTGPTPSESDFSTWAGVHTASESGISTTRFLRTGVVADDDDDAIDGDGEERAVLSVPIAEKAKALFSSSEVTPERLQKWLAEGKPADTVYTRMRLNREKDWLLYLPQFTDWLKYVDDLSAKNPTKGTSAFSTLTAHYGNAALYKMIEEAGETLRTKELATKLQKELIEYWIVTAKAPDDVFHAMGLDKVKHNILSNPEFTTWAKYVDDFNAKYPEKSALMAPALRKYFSDDALIKMTEVAISGGESTSVATKTQYALVHLRLSSRKTPDDALVELGLGKTVDTLMESPLFNTWLKYTNAYSTRYPQDKSTVIEALTRTFDDIDVARMLQEAKTTDATRSIAKQLESAQLEMWLGSGKSVDDVFMLLDLRLKCDFTENPLLNTLVSYMDRVLKENPGQATTLLKTLETLCPDRPLNQILLAAIKFASMEKAAIKIQTEKIQVYRANNESPANVFMWLDLDSVGDKLLSDPLFTKWMQYVTMFNQKNPKHQESWFVPIYWNYNPDPVKRMIKAAMNDPSTVKIAKLVEKERSQRWLDQKDPPRHVFHFLDLEKTGEKTLASSDFKLWPSIWMTSIIAKKDPGTEKLAANLQSALIDKWIVEKKKPSDLKSIFIGSKGDEMNARYVEKLKVLSENTV
ncbi:hypothetical protein PF002_g18884 [Phytophthora fragariae]|uniref:RxLR effector PexRD54 WY domain-containing protein n=1 Tax=Phytophthora fragariae TaxID=53985 RepID=A0A6A4BY43_9STRA|nr:hypothetical protein PF002_g18884 [Phytophthora fragariae]KAE9280444.1 hypothetical protein PF001_g24233 [Phytophthora fragariae]